MGQRSSSSAIISNGKPIVVVLRSIRAPQKGIIYRDRTTRARKFQNAQIRKAPRNGDDDAHFMYIYIYILCARVTCLARVCVPTGRCPAHHNTTLCGSLHIYQTQELRGTSQRPHDMDDGNAECEKSVSAETCEKLTRPLAGLGWNQVETNENDLVPPLQLITK